MSLRSLAALAAVGLLLLTGCQDQPLTVTPEVDPSMARGGPPDNAAAEARINGLITQLFSQPERRDAQATMAQVKRHLADGDEEAAQSDALAIMELLFGSELNDLRDGTSGAEGAAALFGLLSDFVNLPAPDVTPEMLASDDVAVETVDENGETVVTESGEAGVDVPAGAVDQETLFIVARVELGPGEDCLPTQRPQREGCYEYEAIPDQEFNSDVVVGICVDVTGLTPEQIDEIHLYKHDDGDTNVTELPNVPAPFLTCEEEARAPSNPALRLAWRGFRAVARGVNRVVGPQPLRAVDTGLGGAIGSFSRIGWARSTVLIYGPSLTPLNSFRTDNEQTLAEDEGHHTVVVDGPTWASKSATGPGGFGDYDALLFGDVGNLADFADATSNAGTWGPEVGGPTVLSILHPGVHQCDPSLPDCQNLNAEQWQNPEARTLLRQIVRWTTSGTETGLYASLGTRHQNASPPPGDPVGYLSGVASVNVVGSALPIQFLSKEDSVQVLDAGHPVLSGLTGPDFSGWFLSYHGMFADVPAGFTNLADGFRDPDNFFDSELGEWVDGPDPIEPFPVLLVRP